MIFLFIQNDTEVYTGWSRSLKFISLILMYIRDKKFYIGRYLSLYMLIPKFIKDNAEDYSGWCWVQADIEVYAVDTEFSVGRTKVFAKLYWRLNRSILKFIRLIMNFIQVDTKIYRLILKITELDWSINISTHEFVLSYTEGYTWW